MKWIIASLMSLATVAAFAQMPSADEVKAKADTAVDTGAKQAQTMETTATTTTQTTMQKVQKKALVNLNTAAPADLAKLPGIGPTRAQAIVAGRPYNSVSDLKKVKGIKEGVIAKIKDYVTVK